MERLKNPSRRQLLQGKVRTEPVLRLPWSLGEAEFTAKCTQCNDCISACETQIIVRDNLGFPKVDFTKGECTFCHQCVDVCQQPLFKQHLKQDIEQDLKQKKAKPWPVTFDISDKCLAKNDVYCQSCRDVCEPNAIRFRYQVAKVAEPQIKPTDCSQCGACISTCPQDAIKWAYNSTDNTSNEKNSEIQPSISTGVNHVR